MPDDLDVAGTEAEAAVTDTETAEDLEASDGSTAVVEEESAEADEEMSPEDEGTAEVDEESPTPEAEEEEEAGEAAEDVKGVRLARELNRLIDLIADDEGDERKRSEVIREMAREAGISAGAVRQILNERRPILRPPDTRLQGFARVLPVTFAALQRLADRDSEEAKTLNDQGDADAGEQKALSYNDILSRVDGKVRQLVERHFEDTPSIDRRLTEYWCQVLVYADYVIVHNGLQYFRADYSIEGNRIAVDPVEEWVEVEQDWAETKFIENMLVAFGDGVKALGKGMVGGYLVRFTDVDNPDLEQDFFDMETDYGPHRKSLVYYQHGLDEIIGVKRLGGNSVLGDLKVDEVGVWIQAQLDLSDAYEAAVYNLAKKGKLGWSSGTSPHLVRRTLVEGKAWHVDSWPLGLDASLTPTPAAGPGVTKVVPLKSFVQEQVGELPSLKALIEEVKVTSSNATGAVASDPEPDSNPNKSMEDFEMDPEELKTMITGAVQDAVKSVADKVDALEAKLADEPAVNGAGFETGDAGEGESAEQKNFQVMFNARYGGKSDDEVKGLLMAELTAGDYQKFVWLQDAAFRKYLMGGTDNLDREEIKLLKQQVFAPSHVIKAIKSGMTLHSVKDTMVEAQGSLGGFAVPPNRQENIIARLPGLTAVRGGGANVITLTRSNSVELVVYSGGDNRYIGNIRGQWGNETKNPDEQNATLQLIDVVADVYTYKIPMSTSLVEDATNLVDQVENDITLTLAIDEDEAFLVGDGAGKPLGWLPGGLNTLGLNEVNSGDANLLTTAGIKKLKRGVASQYRQFGSFVGNSDTYSDVENLTVSGTGSDFAFPNLSEDGTLLRRPALESGAMSDVAANAFPLLFAAMMGYAIVEKPGMTVMRMQDSGTGINKIELHVRKRVGGRPVELYKAAVQKVAA